MMILASVYCEFMCLILIFSPFITIYYLPRGGGRGILEKYTPGTRMKGTGIKGTRLHGTRYLCTYLSICMRERKLRQSGGVSLHNNAPEKRRVYSPL